MDKTLLATNKEATSKKTTRISSWTSSIRTNKFTALTISSALLLACTSLLLYFSKFNGSLSEKQGTWGQFGDFIGGTLNPTFSFITVVILIATLRTQKSELSEARKIAQQNTELVKHQLSAMKNQALENTFFRMLEEIKNDQIFKNVFEEDKVKNIFKAVYLFEKARHEQPETASRLFSQCAGITIGEFRYVILEKLALICSVIKKIQDNQIHYKVLQNSCTPTLLSAAIHHANYMKHETYKSFLNDRTRLLRGINSLYVVSDKVAADFFPEKTQEDHSKRIEEIIEYWDTAIEEFKEAVTKKKTEA